MKTIILPLLSAAALTMAGCDGESTRTPAAGDQPGAGDRPGQQTTAAADTRQPDPTTDPATPTGTEATTEPPESVVSTVIGRDGDEIGSVVLHPLRQGVRIDLHVEGLEPGTHAVHFHQTADCQTPDFTSAGGHYDPADAEHGMPDSDEDMRDEDHHAGDMRNQTVNDTGMMDVQMVNQSVTIDGDRNPLLDEDGSALVIHAGADDYESQPAGEAGKRVACARIPA